MSIQNGTNNDPAHESPTSTTTKPKFAIAFGAGASKLANGIKQASGRGTKRPHGLLDTEEEEHHEHQSNGVAHSGIIQFGDDAKTKEKVEVARTINALPNRDWREESKRKRQKSGIPGQQQKANGGTTIEVFDPTAKGPQYGLTVVAQTDEETTEDVPVMTEPLEAEGAVTATNDAPNQDRPAENKSADQEALEALLGNRPITNTIIRPASPPPTEDEAFLDSYTSAPRMATLTEYAATPVEGFGAAILRGYLKPGETLENRVAVKDGKKKDGTPVRRPGLLGLGAKDAGTAGVELGAWGGSRSKGAKGKGAGAGPRGEIVYNPIAMRNKKTGQIMTEDELRAALEVQKEEDLRGGGGGRGVKDRAKDYELEHDNARRLENGDDRRRERRSDSDRERHRDDKRRHREYDDDKDYKRRDRRHRDEKYAMEGKRDKKYDEDDYRRRKDYERNGDRKDRRYDEDDGRHRRKDGERHDGHRSDRRERDRSRHR